MIFINFICRTKDNLDIDDLVVRHKQIENFWKAGEKSRVGINSDSGFTIFFPDVENWSTAVPVILDFMEKQKDLLREIHDFGMSSKFVIGATVGEKNSFIPCIDFSLSFMEKLVNINIAIEIVAYPTSDD